MRRQAQASLAGVAIRMLNLSTFALLALLAAAPTDAQEPVPGDVVRVDKGGPWLEFTFREIRGDTVFVSWPDGSIAAVPLASVDRFQVRGAPKPRGETVGVSTLVGASSVGLVGAVIGYAITKREGVSCGFLFPDPWDPCQSRERTSYAREGAIGGALLGGVGGLLVGALVPQYTWRPVHIPSLAVEVAPSSTGVGVGLTWRL